MSRPRTPRSAVDHAQVGAEAWRAAVHAQQAAAPAHSEFYELAGFLVDTLAAVEAIGRVLAVQVGGYPASVPAGSRLYDETRVLDPRERLALAVAALNGCTQAAVRAGAEANRFWSEISAIGTEDDR